MIQKIDTQYLASMRISINDLAHQIAIINQNHNVILSANSKTQDMISTSNSTISMWLTLAGIILALLAIVATLFAAISAKRLNDYQAKFENMKNSADDAYAKAKGIKDEMDKMMKEFQDNRAEIFRKIQDEEVEYLITSLANNPHNASNAFSRMAMFVLNNDQAIRLLKIAEKAELNRAITIVNIVISSNISAVIEYEFSRELVFNRLDNFWPTMFPNEKTELCSLLALSRKSSLVRERYFIKFVEQFYQLSQADESELYQTLYNGNANQFLADYALFDDAAKHEDRKVLIKSIIESRAIR